MDFLQNQKAQSPRSGDLRGFLLVASCPLHAGKPLHIWDISVWNEDEVTCGLQSWANEGQEGLQGLLVMIINANESRALLILVNCFTQHQVCLSAALELSLIKS